MRRIFISKKEDDQLIAKKVRQELEHYLANAVEIKMSQDIPKGAQWREWIKDELRKTDLLLYLITDMNKSLDWGVFEVGMFTPLSEREPNPIVCIYPNGYEAPSQIEHVQGVECNVERLKEFLKDLFDGTLLGESINKSVAEDEEKLQQIAENLQQILTPENLSMKERVYYTRYVSFEINLADQKASEIPSDCEIRGDELSMEVFQLDKTQPGGAPWTWELFKPYFMKALEGNGPTPDEFFSDFNQSILASCRGEKISPSKYCIRSLTSDKKYQPVIHRRDFLGNNGFRIRVLFVQVSEPDTGERNYTFAAPPGE